MSNFLRVKHLEFFRTHPVFTREELHRYLCARGEGGERAAESLLGYHRKSGRVVRIRSGLYASVPPGADPEVWPIDPFLIAARLTPDGILSHHTALELHGKAYSVREEFTYASLRPLALFSFRRQVFRGTTFPRALIEKGAVMFGVEHLDRTGLEVRLTGLERTMVDIMDRPGISGSWEEIWRSLESVEFFDLQKILEYVLLLRNATTAAKVGFFLEQHRESLMVEERHLEVLQDLSPRRPHYLERTRRPSGCFVKRWNLVVPLRVLERSWGEVV